MGEAKQRTTFKGDGFKSKQEDTRDRNKMARHFVTNDIPATRKFKTSDGKVYMFNKNGSMVRLKHG